MMKFKGMKVDEVVKALKEMEEQFEIETDDGEVDCIMVGDDYYGDHIELEVEDGVVVYVEFVEWD